MGIFFLNLQWRYQQPAAPSASKANETKLLPGDISLDKTGYRGVEQPAAPSASKANETKLLPGDVFAR
jgi:cobalamin biosynthesis protein CbiG